MTIQPISRNCYAELKECLGKVFIDSSPEFCPPRLDMVNMSEIDVILVSNYSLILALPYITEGTGFRGVVYATEPTRYFGRLSMLELVNYTGKIPLSKPSTSWKEIFNLLPSPLCDSLRPKSWKKLFSLRELESSIGKIKAVGYDQDIDVFGRLQLRAVSSGSRLGSSNWVISTPFEKIVYVSTSSSLSNHPKLIDKSGLRNANVILLAGLRRDPNINAATSLNELTKEVLTTVSSRGNVLLPCAAVGAIYELLECIATHLEAASFSSVPIYFISPSAEISLAYSSILGEWVSDQKQTKIYIPEDLFPHSYLVKSGRLKYFRNIHSDGFGSEYRQPCIVFCGHPSLRFGDAVHFMNEWADNPLNTLILTDPDVDWDLAVAPYRPFAMKVVHCPIDTSLNFTQANHILKELQPKTLVVPTSYTRHQNQANPALFVKEVCYTLSLECGEVVHIPVKREWVRAEISTILSNRITPVEVKEGVFLALVSASLQVKDNILQLLPLPDWSGTGSQRHQYGSVHIGSLLQKMRDEGLPQPLIELKPPAGAVIFVGEDTAIHVEEDSTHIKTSPREEWLRRKLRDILMNCLSSF